MPNQPWLPDQPGILEFLATAAVAGQALLAAGSNYVFLLELSHPEAGSGYAVYKPQRGEAPLSDFPDGTLFKREYASYVVSEALGWRLVPPTIIRGDGLEMGVGMLQLFVEHDPAQNYFTLKDAYAPVMQRIAVFDWLTNNADRKGGHCLFDANGRIWCIDHGLTFNADEKLRTVIWDFQGQPIPQLLLDDVRRFGEAIDKDDALRSTLLDLLSTAEFERLQQRITLIDQRRVFPAPPAYRPYPWPMI